MVQTVERTNEDIINAIQAGCDLQANMAALYVKNKPFIRKKCSAYIRLYGEEDVMQEAYIIMHRAALSYAPNDENSAGFLTYLAVALKGIPRAFMGSSGNYKLQAVKVYQQYMQLIENGHTKQQAAAQLGLSQEAVNGMRLCCSILSPGSLNAPLLGAEEEYSEAQDFLPDQADIAGDYEEQDEKQRLKSIWGVMRSTLGSGKHADVIEMYYRRGLPLTAVARQLGISSQRAAQIRNEAIKKLRENQSFCSWAAEYTGYLYTAYNYSNSLFFYGNGSAVEFSAEKREKAARRFCKRKWCN